jgi:acetyltransferase-like isoleucine patch superfamily enzyme
MLLSICIPTYNRPHQLRLAVLSIFNSKIFQSREDIEIVVSDNSEGDESKLVMGDLVEANQRVRYVKNNSNNGIDNLLSVLLLGVGRYRKLVNDTAVWTPLGLGALVGVVTASEGNRSLIYMSNSTANPPRGEIVSEVDIFVNKISIDSTWIGGFGVWDDDVDEFKEIYHRKKHEMIPHTYFLLLKLFRKDRVICISGLFFNILNGGRKGGYSLPVIFGKNYISYLKEFGVNAGLIMKETEVSFLHVLKYQFDKNYDFYKAEFYQHLGLYSDISNFKSKLLSHRNRIISGVSIRDHIARQKIWRFLNLHNETILSGNVSVRKVLVGMYSYGVINAQSWQGDDEALFIGNFVSIAENVVFILGGNHPYKNFSTFPVKVKFFNHDVESLSKGPIVVEDDVWIGWGAIIMSGVKIQQGAVIAAGSVVTKDVPAYSVVAGNPARVIKKRFSDDIIKKMLKVNFYNINKENFVKLGARAYEDLNDKNIEEIIYSVL